LEVLNMAIFYSAIILTGRLALASALLLLSACANQYDFVMNDSYQQIRQVQILDPGAAQRNDGIVLNLEGNYGRRVMLEYRNSNVSPSVAQEMGASIITD
jgi:hypothetical protein